MKVEMLSRFRTAKQQKETLRGLQAGSVDIVVGTHRLLSKDVKFHDLGLVIIDEEQRFGVKHKEKLKENFIGVDMLTLSATPIPRTLNMAMSGIRDMSTIEQPPIERQPVETLCAGIRRRASWPRPCARSWPGAGRCITCTTGWTPSKPAPPISSSWCPAPGWALPTAR